MMMEYCFCTKEVSKPYININYWKRNKYFLEIHSHQFWQLIIVISGQLQVKTRESTSVLCSGDIHILPPGRAFY